MRASPTISNRLEKLAKQRVDVVIVLQTSMLLSQGRKIADLALASRLPTVFGFGGLVSYGVDLSWCFHRGASFIGKILQGSNPWGPAGGIPDQSSTCDQFEDGASSQLNSFTR